MSEKISFQQRLRNMKIQELVGKYWILLNKIKTEKYYQSSLAREMKMYTSDLSCIIKEFKNRQILDTFLKREPNHGKKLDYYCLTKYGKEIIKYFEQMPGTKSEEDFKKDWDSENENKIKEFFNKINEFSKFIESANKESDEHTEKKLIDMQQKCIIKLKDYILKKGASSINSEILLNQIIEQFGEFDVEKEKFKYKPKLTDDNQKEMMEIFKIVVKQLSNIKTEKNKKWKTKILTILYNIVETTKGEINSGIYHLIIEILGEITLMKGDSNEIEINNKIFNHFKNRLIDIWEKGDKQKYKYEVKDIIMDFFKNKSNNQLEDIIETMEKIKENENVISKPKPEIIEYLEYLKEGLK